MTTDWQSIIDKYYPAGTLRRDIYLKHVRQVADLALKINAERALGLNPADVEGAAMLHDIGIVGTAADKIGCLGTERYIMHGPLGADLLRREGAPEEWARVAERHTGVGLTADVIAMLDLPLPPGREYCPQTTLERLVCYADKFYSKSGDMQQKSFQRARASIARHGGDGLARFDAMAREFGQPDPQ